jgi:hypothetical protein
METLELKHYGIKGMKWGVRRYQNADGSLTSEGEKRYGRDKRENASKKKDNRIDVSNPDPQRWVREDTERTKQTVDAFSNLNREFQKLEKETSPKSSSATKKMDLSQMSDKEMRDKINRELLEQQYTKLFAEVEQEQVSTGRQICRDVLDATGSILAITSSALGIALAINQLKGK